MTEIKSLKLGEVLFQEGLIEENQLQEALELQKHAGNKRLGEVLLEQGWISDDQLTATLARMFQLPYIQLSDISIDENILKSISYDLIESYKVLPVDLVNQNLTIATNNPLDVAALQDIQYKSGYSINPVMASLSDIEKYIQEYSDSLHTIQAIKVPEQEDAHKTSIIEFVDSIIRQAIKEQASDIHFEPHKDEMRIRFRIDGVLYEKTTVRKDLEPNVISRIKIISGIDVAESRRPQDGRLSFQYGKLEYDIRTSTLPNLFGQNIVLRILNKTYAHRSFEDLGLTIEDITLINRLIQRPHGLILVTGPTGSGKTTTLYSMLNMLNSTSKNIISVEDPVEYELAGINQTAINSFTNYTFAKAIRHILRHDPDIIMVGEIRDVETAEIAIRAALTGHLVLSTIHTNTAVGAITRLLEMKIEPFLISSAVSGVIAQRLVRRLCNHCKQEYTPTKEIQKNIQNCIEPNDNLIFAQPIGCEKCINTGYNNRVGIYEILKVTENIRTKILTLATENEITKIAAHEGMTSLRRAGIQKVKNQITTIDEVMRHTFLD